MTTVEQHKQICRSHTWYSVQERKIGTVRWDYERAAEKTGVADQIRKEAARRLNLKQDWLFHKMVAYSLHFLSKPFRRRRDFEGCRRVAAEYAEKPHRLNAKLAEDNDAKDLGDVTAKMLEQAEDLVVRPPPLPHTHITQQTRPRTHSRMPARTRWRRMACACCGWHSRRADAARMSPHVPAAR